MRQEDPAGVTAICDNQTGNMCENHAHIGGAEEDVKVAVVALLSKVAIWLDVLSVLPDLCEGREGGKGTYIQSKHERVLSRIRLKL